MLNVRASQHQFVRFKKRNFDVDNKERIGRLKKRNLGNFKFLKTQKSALARTSQVVKELEVDNYYLIFS